MYRRFTGVQVYRCTAVVHDYMCTVVVKMYKVTGLEQWYNVYRNYRKRTALKTCSSSTGIWGSEVVQGIGVVQG